MILAFITNQVGCLDLMGGEGGGPPLSGSGWVCRKQGKRGRGLFRWPGMGVGTLRLSFFFLNKKESLSPLNPRRTVLPSCLRGGVGGGGR